MIPYFAPVVFTVPLLGVPIHLFGILVATGILLGVRQVVRRGEQLGLRSWDTTTMTTWGILTGFVISHVFDVLVYQPDALARNPWLLLNPASGLSSFGGFLGMVLGVVVWAKLRLRVFVRLGRAPRRILIRLQRRHRPLLANFDAAVYGGTTGWLFGRLGCFSAKDHPGLPTRFFLGVDYGYHEPGGVRHDLGLYEALFTLGLVILYRVLIRRSRPAGFYLMLTALAYGPVRFGFDFLRVADERYLGLTPAQYGAIALFAVGATMWARGRWSVPPDPIAAAEEGAPAPGA
jgi:phosphatidylglycerol:prolipoprotein diacylglycerol transferase